MMMMMLVVTMMLHGSYDCTDLMIFGRSAEPIIAIVSGQ